MEKYLEFPDAGNKLSEFCILHIIVCQGKILYSIYNSGSNCFTPSRICHFICLWHLAGLFLLSFSLAPFIKYSWTPSLRKREI